MNRLIKPLNFVALAGQACAGGPARPQSTSNFAFNAKLEACLQANVQSWSFLELPVQFGDIHQYFEIIEINSQENQENQDELLSRAYRLRYQVYAIERQIPDFEAYKYPNQEECDIYDRHSVQALLMHRHSGVIVGTARLVRLDDSDPNSTFPWEHYALEDQGFVIPDEIRRQSAEISRFILSPQFRSRKGEDISSDGLVSADPALLSPADKRRSSPHPILGLLKAVVQLSWRHGINYWCAVMESRLHKIMCQLGIQLHEVTAVKYHHLPLILYFRGVHDIMRQCREQDLEFWKFLTDNGKYWPPDSERPKSSWTPRLDSGGQ